VEVDAPVAVRPDALAYFLALLRDAADHLARVVGAADRHVGGAHAECAVAGVHRRLRPIAQRHRSGAAAGRPHAGGAVALAVIAHRAAEDLVHRQTQRLALDVPEREIHRADGVNLLAPRRIEPGDEHLLPDRFDLERILADQRAGALLERVFRAALADAGDAEIGLHRADHVALVEQPVGLRRLVDAYAGDLAARQRAARGLRLGRGLRRGGFGRQQHRGRGGDGRQKVSAVHAGEYTPARGRGYRVFSSDSA
jgi:hypothetical protein